MAIPARIVSLGELLAEGASKASVEKAFSRFVCARDDDVTRFLKHRAFQNESTGASRTYLALDNDKLVNESLVQILAFVTIAITVTDYRGIDEKRRREIMGRVPGLKTTDHFPGYLIAQLARSDAYTNEDFSGTKLLAFAEDLLASAMTIVGGRVVYLDCRQELLDYYASHGYEPIYLDEEKGLYKLVKALG